MTADQAWIKLRDDGLIHSVIGKAASASPQDGYWMIGLPDPAGDVVADRADSGQVKPGRVGRSQSS